LNFHDAQKDHSEETTMKKIALIVATAVALVLPSIANAGDDAAGGAAAGAGVGAATGFVIGGPVGAAVGAGVGGVAGAGAANDHDRRHRGRVIVEERGATQRTDCVRNSYGDERCTTVRR
jgi:hypothetical protein